MFSTVNKKEKGTPESQIIYINFEYEDYAFIKNDMDLHNYIKEKIVNKDKYYLFFDEIQTRTYLSDVYNSILVKDIIYRFNIKDLDLFNKIVEYIVT